MQFLAGCRPMTFQITNCVCDLLPHSKPFHIAFRQQRIGPQGGAQLRIVTEYANHLVCSAPDICRDLAEVTGHCGDSRVVYLPAAAAAGRWNQDDVHRITK